jgi:hypothetical protein
MGRGFDPAESYLDFSDSFIWRENSKTPKLQNSKTPKLQNSKTLCVLLFASMAQEVSEYRDQHDRTYDDPRPIGRNVHQR